MAFNLGQPIAQLAVVSDIHAYSSSSNSHDSVVDLTHGPGSAPNPLTDLIEEIKRQSVVADALLCPGDICNRADYGGLVAAWRELHVLRDALHADQIIATCGNHDLDSRYLSGDPDPDPKGGLLTLKPSFPFDDTNQANKFWARNFAVQQLPGGLVIATLNTSAFHGGRQEEIDYGRVSIKTIEALTEELVQTRNAPGHVLLCHHHPMPMSGWRRGVADIEYLKNGQELLDGLLKATGRSWLVIHGHRHRPKLVHGASGSNAVPFVFGAGSLGARLTGVPNQFHLVRLYASSESDHSSLVGTVETWCWTDSTRWSVATHASGLPPVCGFGYRGQTDALAERVEQCVGPTFAAWSYIREQLPSVDLLMPEDIQNLEMALQRRGLSVLRSGDGRMAQVGR